MKIKKPKNFNIWTFHINLRLYEKVSIQKLQVLSIPRISLYNFFCRARCFAGNQDKPFLTQTLPSSASSRSQISFPFLLVILFFVSNWFHLTNIYFAFNNYLPWSSMIFNKITAFQKDSLFILNSHLLKSSFFFKSHSFDL